MTIPDNSLFCCYCGEKFSDNKGKLKTIDHLIPLSKGGANNPYNKRNCCQRCNTQKGCALPHDWLLRIEERLLFSDLTKSQRYTYEAKQENLKYIIEYLNSAGEKLFANKTRYVWFERRYLKEKQTT